MAHVTLRDGRELDVEDSDTTLLDYYRGEGATVSDEVVVLRPPYTVADGQVIDDAPHAGPTDEQPSSVVDDEQPSESEGGATDDAEAGAVTDVVDELRPPYTH